MLKPGTWVLVMLSKESRHRKKQPLNFFHLQMQLINLDITSLVKNFENLQDFDVERIMLMFVKYVTRNKGCTQNIHYKQFLL